MTLTAMFVLMHGRPSHVCQALDQSLDMFILGTHSQVVDYPNMNTDDVRSSTYLSI